MLTRNGLHAYAETRRSKPHAAPSASRGRDTAESGKALAGSGNAHILAGGIHRRFTSTNLWHRRKTNSLP